MPHRALAGALAVAGAAACWGSVVVTVKVAARGMPVLAITVVEVVSTVALLAAVLAVRRVPVGRPGRALVLAGLLEPGLSYPLLNAGVQRTSGSHAALIIGLEAALIVAGAAVLDRVVPSGRVARALALSVVGAAFLTGGERGSATWTGDLLVAAGIAVATGYVLLVQRRVVQHGPAAATTFWQFVIGSMALAPVATVAALRGTGSFWGRPTSGEVLAALLTGVLGSAVAFGLYNWGLARVSPAIAGVSLGLIPVVGVALSVLFLHEAVSLTTVVAVAAVIAGVLLAATETPRRVTQSPAGGPTTR